MVRRELLDRMLLLGRRHLEITLSGYVAHYNEHRPHRFLGQAPPLGAAPSPLQPPAHGSDGSIDSVDSSTSTPRSHEVDEFSAPTSLYSKDHAVERVAAAVAAARRLGFPFTLTARAENHLRGNPDLEDTIARLRAFETAGADVLYAPGLRTTAEVRAVCDAVSKPVNVLARPGLSMRELVDAGATRVSVGGSLTWAAVNALAAAATRIRDHGDFSALGARPPLRDWFA